jgi:hypothetical protein
MKGLLRVVLIAAIAGCGRGSSIPPAYVAPTPRTPLAITADSLFWQAFRAGAYDQAPRVMRVLKAGYLQNATDHRTAALIGYLHAWQLAERWRLDAVPPEITDHAVLARRYFDQAIAHSPREDARLLGFNAVFRMSEGDIHRDDSLSADGLARGRRAIAAWPEFNGFTVGYVLSARRDTSSLFRHGLELQWRTMDLCSRAVIDRANPRVELAVAAESTETDARRRRACWNTAIAPHNAEGFFLNMGDMLVKSGDWRMAQRIYAHAKVMRSYQAWPFRSVLESRIENAERNVAAFRGVDSTRTPRVDIMLRSPFACMACHQAASR